MGSNLIAAVPVFCQHKLLIVTAVIGVNIYIGSICGLFSSNVQHICSAVPYCRNQIVVPFTGTAQFPDVVNCDSI